MEECNRNLTQTQKSQRLSEGKCANIKKHITSKKMKCGHHFHEECIHKWLKFSSTCPVCRADVKMKLKVKIYPQNAVIFWHFD